MKLQMVIHFKDFFVYFFLICSKLYIKFIFFCIDRFLPSGYNDERD